MEAYYTDVQSEEGLARLGGCDPGNFGISLLRGILYLLGMDLLELVSMSYSVIVWRHLVGGIALHKCRNGFQSAAAGIMFPVVGSLGSICYWVQQCIPFKLPSTLQQFICTPAC